MVKIVARGVGQKLSYPQNRQKKIFGRKAQQKRGFPANYANGRMKPDVFAGGKGGNGDGIPELRADGAANPVAPLDGHVHGMSFSSGRGGAGG